MPDNIFDNLDLSKLPKLDTSYTASLASRFQVEMDEAYRQAVEIEKQNSNNKKRMQAAMEQTAANTSEANVRLQKVIDNQSDHIEMLKKQLEVAERQLDVLQNLFASGEDGVAVEKEIMELIRGKINSDHPLWDYVADKGGDIAVAAITAAGPVIYSAFKLYLASKGIISP